MYAGWWSWMEWSRSWRTQSIAVAPPRRARMSAAECQSTTGSDSICSRWSNSASTTSCARARWAASKNIGPDCILRHMLATLLASVIAIKAGTLIDGRADAPRHNQTIVIRDNRIAAVGADVAIPADAKIIDLSQA